MALRSLVSLRSSMEGVASRTSLFSRYFSNDGKGGDGRIFGDEERAKETVFIKKLEREQLEKIKKKLGYVEKEGEDLYRDIIENAEKKAEEEAQSQSQSRKD